MTWKQEGQTLRHRTRWKDRGGMDATDELHQACQWLNQVVEQVWPLYIGVNGLAGTNPSCIRPCEMTKTGVA